eukprot:128998-Pleurochrysis_carterae.AAC.1
MLVLGALCDAHAAAQTLCLEVGLSGACASALRSSSPLLRCWGCLCLGKLVGRNRAAAAATVADPVCVPRLLSLLADETVEVRAAA